MDTLRNKTSFTPAVDLDPVLKLVYAGREDKLAPLIGTMDLNAEDPVTGMTALHIAVGRNNLSIAKMLVEAGANFVPDREGRMPSTIAAVCEVSDELSDYIVDAEEKALSQQDAGKG